MYTHAGGAVRPHDVRTSPGRRRDTRDDAVPFPLDEPIEDHLASSLALGLGALARGLLLTRMPETVEWAVRWLGRAA